MVSWLRRKRARWLLQQRLHRMARQVARRSRPAPDQSPVVFFNASTRLWGLSQNAAFQILTAWSLRLAGVPVVHVVCRQGLSHCLLAAAENPAGRPPCRLCLEWSQRMYARARVEFLTPAPAAGLESAVRDLSVRDLMDLVYQGVPLGALVTPSVRWALRRHHLPDDEITRSLFRRFVLGAWSVRERFRILVESLAPQAVVVFNGLFYPEATACWVAMRRGIPVITHEIGLRPFSAFFTHGPNAPAYPIQVPHTFELTPPREARLQAYLEKRFQGAFTMAGVRFWPRMLPLDEAWEQRLREFRQMVPVFTNVVFDTSQVFANIVFSDMFAWLDTVLDIIRDHPETLFVFRAHPDEHRPGKAARESVRDWVRRRGVDRLPNAVFVDSHEYLSSYALIQRAKFVMVYNSTIGLEAVILGKRVLFGGKARFTPYGIGKLPRSPREFRRTAEVWLRASRLEVSPAQMERARKFLYYQLYKVSLPFGQFLEPFPGVPGYVLLKDFPVEHLYPQRSPTLQTLYQGIVEGRDFVFPEEAEYAEIEAELAGSLPTASRELAS